MSEKAIPHHIHARHYAELVNRPTTEVVLEPARGPMGQAKLHLDKRTWEKIVGLLPARCGLAEEQTVVQVEQGSRIVTALAEALPRTADWPEKDRGMLQRVMRLLYQHNGLVISKR